MSGQMPLREELDALMAVMAAAFDPAFGEAWTRPQVEGALAIPGTRCRLLAADGSIGPVAAAEAAGFYLSRTIVDEDELMLIAVAPKWRGRGLGAVLLDHLCRQAEERGSRLIHLEMRADNEARRLYTRFGFKPVGRRPDYYRTPDGSHLDAITFVKRL